MSLLPILFIVTADNCGACRKLHQIWPTMIDDIQSSHQVGHIITVELTQLGQSFDDPNNCRVEVDRSEVNNDYVPNDLNDFIGFYPSLILVETKSYNANMRNSKNKLNGLVFNGQFIVYQGGRQIFPVDQHQSTNRDTVIQWLNEMSSTL
jgi:hypothetical protein